MRRLDELHLDYPIQVAQMLRSLLGREGASVDGRHMATLMNRMGISAIHRCPNASKPEPGHKFYPYLLRLVKIERPDQGYGYRLHSDAMRLRLSGGSGRRLQQARTRPSRFDHEGSDSQR